MAMGDPNPCVMCGAYHFGPCRLPTYWPPFPQYFTAPSTPDSGWTCPRCQRIYAPQTAECKRCNDDVEKTERLNSHETALADLLSQKSMLARMLAATPDESVVDRATIESRMEAIDEEIQELRGR